MIEKKLTTQEIELVSDLIAEGVDRAGEEKTALFLAKLSLVLANLVGDSAQIGPAVEAALRDL